MSTIQLTEFTCPRHTEVFNAWEQVADEHGLPSRDDPPQDNDHPAILALKARFPKKRMPRIRAMILTCHGAMTM